MKFGSQLKDAIYPEWNSHYINYNGLKKKLRKAGKDGIFTEKDESEFVELLDNNLEKVYAFHKEKASEIKSRTDYWADYISTSIPGNDDVAEMAGIQEKINEIADDINCLSRFSRLNYTGFLKIVKKHDRYTDYVLRPMFMVRLNQCPFWKEDNDALLIKLSELFSKVRDGGRTMSFKAVTKFNMEHGQTISEAKRTVIKRFFVQTDNVLELKTFVLRHLPVLVYRDNTSKQNNIDPPVSTLYLDNADLDMYNSRVEAAPESEIFRFRWYGSAKGNRSITFERRTLLEGLGEKKDCFEIKDKYIDGFLRGEQTFIEKTAKKLQSNSGKSEDEVQKTLTLIRDVQKAILDNDAQPVLRTFYKRTAFQIPGDNRVRMALDTDLCFIREDSQLFPDDHTIRRLEGAWCRPDVDINFPFTDLKSGEISRYPFATFEIKMELWPEEREPGWIVDLQSSGLLEEAFDFRKFVHGIAIMFDTRVALLPYWLAQMGEHINDLPLSPSQSSLIGKSIQAFKSNIPPEERSEDEGEQLETRRGDRSRIPPPEPTERTSLLASDQPSTTSYLGVNLQPGEPTTSRSHPGPSNGFLDNAKFVWSTLFQTNSDQTNNTVNRREPVVLPPGVKIPKKIISPLKVEPKVFFANERTFFSWMSFGTLLTTFSVALFNTGDAVGKVSGIVYTLVSLSTLIYGMGLYYRRRELIWAKAPGPYDELTGPTVICLSLLFAVGLNAYLKFTVKSPSLLYF